MSSLLLSKLGYQTNYLYRPKLYWHGLIMKGEFENYQACIISGLLRISHYVRS